MMMKHWISGPSSRTRFYSMTKTTLLQSKVFNVLEPSSLVSKIYLSFYCSRFISDSSGWMQFIQDLSPSDPSEDALENISRFHIDRFEGELKRFF